MPSIKFQPMKLLHLAGFEGIAISLKNPSITWKLPKEGQEAAWELYIELVTRTLTADLDDDLGQDTTALNSVFSIFETTREVLRRRGVRARNLAKTIVPILNQQVRPFTTKWHSKVCTDETNPEFRKDLQELRTTLRGYTDILAHLAGVEDMSNANLPPNSNPPQV